MLLGDSAVGKTCVLVRFKDGAFLGGNFIATVGIDFRVRDLHTAAGLDSQNGSTNGLGAFVSFIHSFILFTR